MSVARRDPTASRIGIYMPAVRLARMRHITEKFGVSQSHLIAALCSVLTDKDIGDALTRYEKLGQLEVELRETADQHLLDYVRGKSVEDLERMLSAARAVEGPPQ